jgi:microcystin-dependent protein
LVNVGEDIVPSQHNPPLTDIAQSLTGSLSRDGLGGMRNSLPMGGFRVTNMADGVQPTDAVTVQQLSAGAGGVPSGCVLDFAGTTPPTGWLLCAGQTLSRADYASLFAAIGTAYGAPSGATFNLPDCRGRVSAGRDVDQGGFAGRLTSPNSQTIGAAGGAQSVTLTPGQMPIHTHEVTGSTNSAGSHAHTIQAFSGETVLVGNGGNLVLKAGGAPYATDAAGTHSHSISVSAANAGGNEAHSNVQPTIILTKIIKV